MAERDLAIVLVAGGVGSRFGADGGKQLARVHGRPLLSHTLEACCAVVEVALVVVVAPTDRAEEYALAVKCAKTRRVDVVWAPSGLRRQDSVRSGLACVPEGVTYIAVHDGARPLATPDLFSALREKVARTPEIGGAVIGHPAVDTLKLVDDGVIASTPDRSRYWLVQTPQLFRAEVLRKGYAIGPEGRAHVCDDATLVEATGALVAVLEGPRDNIKVTVPADRALAEAIMLQRRGGASG